MKRCVCLLLMFALLCGLLPFAAAEEQKIALTALMVVPEGTDREALDALMKEAAEIAGVEMSVETQTEAEWAKNKKKTLASGKLPDVLFNAADEADIAEKRDLFMELSLLSFRHAPALEAMFSDEPDTLALASDVNEEIYSVPAFLGVEPACESVMFINQTWLDKLNLSMPQTLDDLKAVLKAFRENDCNGNGDASDEIPLDYTGWFGSPYSLTNLIGAWGVQLTNGGADGFFAENGEVKNYAVDERYRALLLYLHELYAEGLIYDKVTKNDETSFLARSHGDKQGLALVGVVMGKSADSQFGEALKDQYVPLPPLSNQNDMLTTSETRWTYDYSGLNIVANRAVISADCSAPEAAMRYLDAFYRADLSVKTLQSGLSGLLPVYIRRADAQAMSPEKDAERAERAPYEEALSNIDMMTEYYPQAFMNYSAREFQTMDSLLTKVNKTTQSWWKKFLTGKADIASQWDSYVQQVSQAGLPDLLAIRQRAFDTFVGK